MKLVDEGRLPAGESDDIEEIIGRIIHATGSGHLALSPEAIEILLTAVAAEGAAQGNVHAIQHDAGFVVMVGGGTTFGSDDRRTQAKYKQGINQLINAGFLEHVSAELHEVTAAGYLAADDLAVGGSQE